MSRASSSNACFLPCTSSHFDSEDPTAVPWDDVDIIVECTGEHKSLAKLKPILTSAASVKKSVMIDHVHYRKRQDRVDPVTGALDHAHVRDSASTMDSD